MNTDAAIAAFTRLAREDKIVFLLRLARELTVVGRDTYVPGGTGLECPERLRALNEIQHRLLAGCQGLVQDSPERFPDDVLVHIVLDEPQDVVLQRQLQHAFERALAQQAPAA